MATLQQLCDEVYEVTARPDLVLLTQQSVRDAIRNAHLLQDWPRDVIRANLLDYVAPPQAQDFRKSFVTLALPSDLRKIIRVIATYNGGATPRTCDGFVLEQTRELFQYTGEQTPNTYRVLGTNIEIGFREVPDAIALEYYGMPQIVFANPDEDPPVAESHTSWILQLDAIEFIVKRAAQKVLRSIGAADDARALDAEVQLASVELLTNYS